MSWARTPAGLTVRAGNCRFNRSFRLIRAFVMKLCRNAGKWRTQAYGLTLRPMDSEDRALRQHSSARRRPPHRRAPHTGAYRSECTLPRALILVCTRGSHSRSWLIAGGAPELWKCSWIRSARPKSRGGPCEGQSPIRASCRLSRGSLCGTQTLVWPPGRC